MTENVAYFLVKKRSDGRLQSLLNGSDGKAYVFRGRMLPDRMARALRADGKPYFVVSCDLNAEEPQILEA